MKYALQAILVTLFVSAVMACNSPSQVPLPGSPHAPAAGTSTSAGSGGAPNGPISMGTGDGGGGNTCNGKAIETYRYDVTERPAFKKYINPVLMRIPPNDIQRLMTYAIRSKKWFMIPCELKTLSTDRIGASVATEQGALQNFTEVWNAKAQIEKMEAHGEAGLRDEAELIMHEIGMSLRLIQFDSVKQQCLAFAPRAELCEGLDDRRKGEPKDLTRKDYEMVRRFTSEIFTFRGTTTEDWEDFLGTLDFYISEGKPMVTKAERQQVTWDELQKGLQEQTVAGFQPNHGQLFQNGTLVRSETCSVEVTLGNDRRGQIKVTRAGGEALTVQVQTEGSMNGYVHRKTGLAPLHPVTARGSTVGERWWMTEIYRRGEALVGIKLSEMIVVGHEDHALPDGGSYTSTPSRNPSDGRIYYCTNGSISGKVLQQN